MLWAPVDEVRTRLERQDPDLLERLNKIRLLMDEIEHSEKEDGRSLRIVTHNSGEDNDDLPHAA